MKIGFVVHFFDFRNDVRRLISEITNTHEVILFVKKEHEKAILAHPIANTEIRIIEERKNTLLNKTLEQLFFFLRRLPKSRQNFFLMECFKIANIKNEKIRASQDRKLRLLMKLPKFLKYDTFLSLLKYKGETKINDIDEFVFFTEISDDYLLSRCIKEKKNLKVYVYSWDHPYKHTRFSNKVNYLCWSNSIKDDLIDLQHVSPECIKVWGASQFAYINEALSLKSLGARTFNFPYIYYVCAIGIENLVPQEISIIRYINNLIKEFAPSLKLVVRPYPVLSNWEYYDLLKAEGVILDDDFRSKDLSMSEKSIQEKFEKVNNSELLLHLGTTLGLEASFFSSPSLLIDFGYDKNATDFLHVKHFIHQGQNDKYLRDACPEQHLQSEDDFKKWILLAAQGKAKEHSLNNLIANQFSLKSFEKLATSI